jgi:hypothetical protein
MRTDLNQYRNVDEALSFVFIYAGIVENHPEHPYGYFPHAMCFFPLPRNVPVRW